MTAVIVVLILLAVFSVLMFGVARAADKPMPSPPARRANRSGQDYEND